MEVKRMRKYTRIEALQALKEVHADLIQCVKKIDELDKEFKEIVAEILEACQDDDVVKAKPLT